MMDVDELLRDYGERWRAVQPAPPAIDLNRLVSRGRRGPGRVPVAAAAAVALVIGGISAAVTLLPGGGRTTSAAGSAVVPWRPLPAAGLFPAPYGAVIFSQGLQYPVPPPAPAGWSALRATLHLPATAPVAGPVDYAVTLSNPTARAIALDPCPAYAESLRGDGTLAATTGQPVGGAVSAQYGLNCAAAGLVPAHGSVTFAMRSATFDSSFTLATGTARLTWGLSNVIVSGVIQLVSAPTSTPVPWQRLPAGPVAAPSFSVPPAAPKGLRSCSGSDLVLSFDRQTQPVPGQIEAELRFVNSASTACAVSNQYNPGVLLDGRGAALDVDAFEITPLLSPSSFALQPGETVQLGLSWTKYCGPDPGKVALRVGTILTTPHVLSAPGCAGDPRLAAALSLGHLVRVVPGSQDGLLVSVSAPTTATPGYPLRYQVELSNPSSDAVPLAPCPTYTERLDLALTTLQSAHGGAGPADYVLNCTAAPAAVPAQGSVSFAMQIDLPPGLPLGPAQVSWHLGRAGQERSGATARLEIAGAATP